MNVSGRAVVIKNSPIEFVVSGPVGGRDRIIARTEDAGLDLVGKAVHRESRESYERSNFPFSLLLEHSAQLNTVTGGYVPDARSEVDDRDSMLAFTWRGHATSHGVRDVAHAFRTCSSDIYMAYCYGDEQDVELQVSPLIYQCSLANDNAVRSRRMMRFFLVAYSLIGLGVSLWYVFKNFGN
jgi:hypothetical protein